MIQVSDILKRAADKMSLQRVRFIEKNIPTSIENIVVIPFFGDVRSSFILSSFLLKRIKEETKSSKYIILISWPEHVGLYPYVDEYWTVPEENAEKMAEKTESFENTSPVFSILLRNLNHWFYDILFPKDLSAYYNNGITQEFFNKFKVLKVNFPSVPSIASMGIDFVKKINEKNLKVFIYPTTHVFTWRFNGLQKIKAPKNFWIHVVESLVKNNFYPIVYKDNFCYDLSLDLTENINESKWSQINDQDMLKVLATMRSCSCVLDIFSGISRMALMARTPFICFDERNKFKNLKDYELDDLCGKKTPHEYIFGFANTIDTNDKSQWDINIVNILISKLNKFIPKIDRDSLPSTAESNEVVLYENVRKYKTKKLGSKFIKIERD